MFSAFAGADLDRNKLPSRKILPVLILARMADSADRLQRAVWNRRCQGFQGISGELAGYVLPVMQQDSEV